MKPRIRYAFAAIVVPFTLAALSAPAQAQVQAELSGHWAGYGGSASVDSGPPGISGMWTGGFITGKRVPGGDLVMGLQQGHNDQTGSPSPAFGGTVKTFDDGIFDLTAGGGQ